MADKQNIAEFIQEARERFTESESAESDNRKLSLRDIKFENGDQWTEDEKNERKGRPCLTINKVAGSVKQTLGDARMNRPRIKVRPVDSEADPLTAQIFTGLISNIENVSDAESAYDNGHDNAVRGAIGYWRILTDYSQDDTFDQDIFIDRIVNSASVYYDQAALKTSYEDAEYCFLAETLRRSKFRKLYPKAESSDWEKGEGESEAGWFTDDSVRIAEYWYKVPYTKHLFELMDGKVIEIEKPKITKQADDLTGELVQFVFDEEAEEPGAPVQFKRTRKVQSHKVKWCKISGREILEGPQEWPGKYIPIVPCLGEEIWIEGKRILRSAIRHAIEPQKLYNWARSNNMETLALSPKQPWLMTPEQLGEFKKMWNKAYTTPMPYLLYNNVPGQDKIQRLTGSIGDSGANQEAMLAADDIKATTGIYDASLGARGNETSGKAINARQRQGDVATFIFSDNQVRAIKYTGKILVDLIPKIYDSDRIVRLMGDDLNKKFNPQKLPPGMPAPEGKPILDVSNQGTEAWARINYTDPITGKTYFDLSVGKYDIVIDAGPGHATRRQEAADGMIQLAQAAPPALPVLVPRIAKNLDWPEADEIGDELKAVFQPPQPQGPTPKDQLDMAKGKMELQKGQMDIEGKRIDLAGKAQTLQAGQVDQQQAMAQIAQQVVLGTLKQIGILP